MIKTEVRGTYGTAILDDITTTQGWITLRLKHCLDLDGSASVSVDFSQRDAYDLGMALLAFGKRENR